MAKVIARPPASDLYEEDFPLWAERQAALLRAGRFDELDLENLIEEVEDLSRRERKSVESYVETIVEHLLKVALSPAERPRRGWLVTIDKQRAKLASRADADVAESSGIRAAGDLRRAPTACGATAREGPGATGCTARSLSLHP